jgi:hypothetical protein
MYEGVFIAGENLCSRKREARGSPPNYRFNLKLTENKIPTEPA